MAKLLELEKSTNIDGVLKDISNSVEVIQVDLVEKRMKIAELKVLIEINYDQEEIDVAQEFFEICIDNFEIDKEDVDLSKVYATWVLNNKLEENPDCMECHDPNSSRESTPKRYSSDAESMASSSKRSRNFSESTSEFKSISDVVDPHPDLVSLHDTPIVRIFTTHSPKMARMIDLL